VAAETGSRTIVKPPTTTKPATKKPAAKKPASPGAPRRSAATGAKGLSLAPKAAAPKRPRRKAAPDAVLELARLVEKTLEDDKAENIVTIDLAGKAAFADRMIIATGMADRQLQAMATHVTDALEKAGVKRVRIEGASGSDWVLLDAGDIVVHLFRAEARAAYGLERMWGEAFPEASDAG
jgi:ribosome-associated protein